MIEILGVKIETFICFFVVLFYFYFVMLSITDKKSDCIEYNPNFKKSVNLNTQNI
jgi:hypothetical protein